MKWRVAHAKASETETPSPSRQAGPSLSPRERGKRRLAIRLISLPPLTGEGRGKGDNRRGV